MGGRTLRALIGAALLLGLAASASAEAIEDDYYVVLSPDNTLIDGGGSGWVDPASGAQWFYYPQTEWWNQWFYDHPVRPPNWKKIWYYMEMFPTQDGGAYVEVAINYSTRDYSNDQQPPLPPTDDFIVRELVFSDFVVELVPLDFGITIPDYNPEWVSIDIRVVPDVLVPPVIPIPPSPIAAHGIIFHECIPEPATLSLLAIGAFGLIRRRRK